MEKNRKYYKLVEFENICRTCLNILHYSGSTGKENGVNKKSYSLFKCDKKLGGFTPRQVINSLSFCNNSNLNSNSNPNMSSLLLNSSMKINEEHENEDLPTNICYSCMEKLRVLFAFNKLSNYANETLKNALVVTSSSSPSLSLQAIKQRLLQNTSQQQQRRVLSINDVKNVNVNMKNNFIVRRRNVSSLPKNYFKTEAFVKYLCEFCGIGCYTRNYFFHHLNVHLKKRMEKEEEFKKQRQLENERETGRIGNRTDRVYKMKLVKVAGENGKWKVKSKEQLGIICFNIVN